MARKVPVDAPWNALLYISLDALVLRINVTQGIVYLTYTTSINLGFVSIGGLGLLYQRARTDPTAGESRRDGGSASDLTFGAWWPVRR